MTIIPLPLKHDISTHFSKGVIFYPIIGLIIGLFLKGTFSALLFLNNRPLLAFFILLSEIIITGGLHLDGLADTFDGIFSFKSKKDILNIMQDSNIGIYGTLGLILLIIFKLLLYVYMPLNILSRIIIFIPVISRMNISWSAGLASYAGDNSGLGKMIINNTGIKETIISTLLTLIIINRSISIDILIIILSSIIFTLLFTLSITKKIDGITGDILGAVIELNEVFMLFIIFLIN